MLALYAGTLTSDTDVLAWESAADEINSFNVTPVDLRDIPKIRDAGVVLRVHLTGVRVDLRLPLHVPASTFQTEAESFDA
jgi:ABC-type transporter Mla MlaB component